MTAVDAHPLQGLGRSPFIIAEIGNNHGGDLDMAERLIDAAVDAGADAAKFQSFVPSEMAVPSLAKAAYQAAATDSSESQFTRLERVRLTESGHYRLAEYCRRRGVLFCSSPFDVQSARLLRAVGVPFVKIPSGELTHHALLEEVATYGVPVLLSTGMADVAEVSDALDALGSARERTVLLHCTSAYPAEWRDANLRVVTTLRTTFGLSSGFSDHTRGTELALVALGLGAVVFEKHLTLDRTLPGGDHRASLEPQEFTTYVQQLREATTALGDGVRRCLPSELDVRRVARKSVVAGRDIPKGTVIEGGMLAFKRPGTGLAPVEALQFTGRAAVRDIAKDELLQMTDVEGVRTE